MGVIRNIYVRNTPLKIYKIVPNRKNLTAKMLNNHFVETMNRAISRFLQFVSFSPIFELQVFGQPYQFSPFQLLLAGR